MSENKQIRSGVILLIEEINIQLLGFKTFRMENNANFSYTKINTVMELTTEVTM